MNSVFNRIADTRSLTLIDRLVQEAIEDGATGNDLQYLNAIAEENDLDSIYVIALVGAGRIDEAAKLQVEIDGFKARKAARESKA